jgi:tetratricopeptide (TPR) repeat protein
MMHFRYRIAGLCLLAAIVGGANVGCEDDDATVDTEMHRRLAVELRDARLYQPAIEEYSSMLQAGNLSHAERANLHFLIGRIYYDDLGDYTQAAAHFVRARTLNPDADFVAEASRKLVASLERSGRIADARRQMDASVNIDTEPRQPGDVAVAVIGNDTVWSSALERAIGELPPEQQADLASHTDRIEFMRQYVAREMIYRAALREDYASRPEIQRQQHALLKQLLVNAFIMDKIMPTIDSDSLDIHNFYQANKTTRYNNRPLDSVMTQVVFDYSNEKARAAFDQYIQKLARAEQVEFFDRNVR